MNGIPEIGWVIVDPRETAESYTVVHPTREHVERRLVAMKFCGKPVETFRVANVRVVEITPPTEPQP